MKNRIQNIIIFFSFIFFLVFSSFMIYKNENRQLRKFYFKNQTKNGNDFINDSLVRNIIAEKIKWDSVKIKSLEVNDIERWLYKNPFIKKAEVYTTVQGALVVEITQKNPLVRVKNDIDQYYLTQQGQRIPLSDVYSVNAMIAVGPIDSLDYKPLVSFVKYINRNKLLKKNIIGIRKIAKNSFILKVSKGNYIIDFGSLDDFDEKFTKLRLFYNQYLSKMDFNKYKRITLSYKNQVIAQKK